MGGVEGRGVAMGAVACRRGHEHDGGTGCGGRGNGGLGEVAGEGDGGKDELAAALGNKTGETRSGVGGAELDDAEVAIELLPGVGEDASAGVGLVAGVFGAIGACLALCDDTLGGLGDGVGAVVGVRRRRRAGIGCEEPLCLVEVLSCGGELFAEVVGLAVAGGEEVGELCVGLGGRGRGHGIGGGGLWGERHVDVGVDEGQFPRRGSYQAVSGQPADASAGVSPPRHATLARPVLSNLETVGLAQSLTLALDEQDPSHPLPAAPPSPASWLPCGPPSPHNCPLPPPRGHFHVPAPPIDRAHVVACFPRSCSSRVATCSRGLCLVSAPPSSLGFFFALRPRVMMPPAPAS